ncbi:putative ribonuclease H-like domain-containing protein [Tanacetum coccineum]|uniref:Ribonuclease H-like domain-containing protein n=1 Tax=Tanacetum coccineum TaxID=301880 RepID=A0ABQ5FZ25_9ASTR
MGFINGTCNRVDYAASASLLEQWDRCDVVVLNWMLSSLSQDVYLGHVFSDNDATVWKELQETYDRIDGSIVFNLEFYILTKLLYCTCAAKAELNDHGKLLKLMQFLMGLDDVYQPIRSSNNVDVTKGSVGNNDLSASTSSISLTNEQVMKLMNLLNEKSGSSAHANMAGHPNGTLAKITHDRNLKLNKNDLKRETVLGTSSESVGLYLFDKECDKSIVSCNSVETTIAPTTAKKRHKGDAKSLLQAVEKQVGRNVCYKKNQRNLLKAAMAMLTIEGKEILEKTGGRFSYEWYKDHWENNKKGCASGVHYFNALVSCDGYSVTDWSDPQEEIVDSANSLGYNVVPLLYTGNFMPPKPDLSFSGLKEFTSEPVVIKHVVENSEAKASKAKPKAVRKNNGAQLLRQVNVAHTKTTVNVARPMSFLSKTAHSTDMHKKFQMSSMGELTFFLGLQVKRKEDRIFISQDKYATGILKKFGFTNVKTASTPMETQKLLLKDEDGEEVDVHLYRSMIGSLMYLTSSRPDIMFAVCAYARYQYPKDSPFDLVAYTDSDYAGASLDRKSTTGDCQFLGCRLILWQCKKHTVVANSTTEAEYVDASSCRGQVLWIQNQLLDYGDCNEKKLIQMVKIHTDKNVADLLTKAFDFWATVKAKTVNGDVQLKALVDGKKIIITESIVRRDLQLKDAEGIDCLPNATIFEQLTLMGYEKVSQKLTFYKAFFSPQWKFLIHTLLQYLSAKTTAWNEFSSTMASAIICLATNQKFNFSKYIFESMVKNLDNVSGKFLMYQRFVQVFLEKQLEGMSSHKRIYVTPSHTKKIFGNMRRVGKGFSGRETPLFQTMVVQHQEEMGEDEAINEEMDDSLERVATNTGLDAEQDRDNINKTQSKATPNDPSSLRTSSGENKGGSRTHRLKRLYKVGGSARMVSSDDASLGDQEDAFKQGRKTDDIDKYAEITLIDETQGRYGDDLMFDRGVLDDEEVFAGQDMDEKEINVAEKEISIADPVTTAGEVVTTASPTETKIVDDLTLAKTLIELRSAKSKVKGVMIGEQSESTTRTRPQQLPSKDKAKLEEEDRLVRQREEETNIVSWDNVQAMIDADYQMAQQMQAEEQEKLSIEEKSKLFL